MTIDSQTDIAMQHKFTTESWIWYYSCIEPRVRHYTGAFKTITPSHHIPIWWRIPDVWLFHDYVSHKTWLIALHLSNYINYAVHGTDSLCDPHLRHIFVEWSIRTACRYSFALKIIGIQINNKCFNVTRLVISVRIIDVIINIWSKDTSSSILEAVRVGAFWPYILSDFMHKILKYRYIDVAKKFGMLLQCSCPAEHKALDFNRHQL